MDCYSDGLDEKSNVARASNRTTENCLILKEKFNLKNNSEENIVNIINIENIIYIICIYNRCVISSNIFQS